MPRGFLVTKVTGLPCINVKNENWTVGRIDLWQPYS